MPIALTTIPTIATTRATEGLMPKMGSSTAKPRKPIVGDPLMRADTAASAPVFFLKQYLKTKYTSMKQAMMPTVETIVSLRSLTSISREACTMDTNRAAGRA